MNHIIKHTVASQQLVQIVTLKFKSSLYKGNEVPMSFRDVAHQLQEVPGVSCTYLGEQLEHPGTWTWAIRWASAAALDAFLASPSFTNWAASFRAVAESYVFWKALVRGNLSGALNAPCTEVFTAYGTSDDWLDAHMKPFAMNVDAAHLAGHHGSAIGQYDVFMHDTPDTPQGNTVSMLLGWDSKEAHLNQRGDGKCEFFSLATLLTRHSNEPCMCVRESQLTSRLVIDNNIHYTRGDRKSTNMVSFNCSVAP